MSRRRRGSDARSFPDVASFPTGGAADADSSRPGQYFNNRYRHVGVVHDADDDAEAVGKRRPAPRASLFVAQPNRRPWSIDPDQGRRFALMSISLMMCRFRTQDVMFIVGLGSQVITHNNADAR